MIRLAHQNPELRPHLLPLLKTAGVGVRVTWEEDRVTFLGPDARVDVAVRFSGGRPPEVRDPELEGAVDEAWAVWYDVNRDPNAEEGFNTSLIDRVKENPQPVRVTISGNDWAALRAYGRKNNP